MVGRTQLVATLWYSNTCKNHYPELFVLGVATTDAEAPFHICSTLLRGCIRWLVAHNSWLPSSIRIPAEIILPRAISAGSGHDRRSRFGLSSSRCSRCARLSFHTRRPALPSVKGKEGGRARRSSIARLDTGSPARPHHGSHRWLYCEKIGSQHMARASYFSIAAWLDPRAQVRRAAAPRRGTRRSLLVERHCCQPCCQTLSGSYVKDTNWVH